MLEIDYRQTDVTRMAAIRRGGLRLPLPCFGVRVSEDSVREAKKANLAKPFSKIWVPNSGNSGTELWTLDL